MADDEWEQRLTANRSGSGVFAVLGWIDPSGRWWMAPLGTPAPDPGEPVPAEWQPVERLERDDLV